MPIMTTTKQALRPFSELQTEAATGFAMSVFTDPASSIDHRDAAKRHLMRPAAEGIDWTRVPLVRRHQILLALDDLKRLAEDGDCFVGELDNQSEFARAYQATDGRISPGEFALLASLRLTPLERRARWDDLDLAEIYGLLRVGGVQLAPEATTLPPAGGKVAPDAERSAPAGAKRLPDDELPAERSAPAGANLLPAESSPPPGGKVLPLPELNPFTMPLAEQPETSAADFIELDLVKKPKLEPKPANRRLADHELTGEAADAVRKSKLQQFRDGVLGSRR